MTEYDIRGELLDHLVEGFRKTFSRPDGSEYARRFADGRVVFVVSREGIDIRDLTLSPVENGGSL